MTPIPPIGIQLRGIRGSRTVEARVLRRQSAMPRDSLEPKLEMAQQALDVALEQACGVDVRKANTGEMIRIEETLEIAHNAAKEVVSVRLRRRAQKDPD